MGRMVIVFRPRLMTGYQPREVSLERDIIFVVWLILMIFLKVFACIEFYEGAAVTCPDEVFELIKDEPYFEDVS